MWIRGGQEGIDKCCLVFLLGISEKGSAVKGKSVLVTGGAGFIGSHLTRSLLNEGARVRVLDNCSNGRRINLADVARQVDFCEGDIRNAIACRNACRGIEVVFHLAAYISVPGSLRDPVTADAVNIGGTLNMLLAARDCGVRRFVFSSSAAVYGDTDVLPTPEEALPFPLSPYGVEKLYGEHMARLYHQPGAMETASLRYFNVYGPGQNPLSDYAAVIPRFITQLLARESPVIYGDGEQTRDFLYVEDVVRANLLAARAKEPGGGVYNVAGGQAVSLNALYGALCEATGVRRRARRGPERSGDIRYSAAEISRAREVLGFEPAFDLPEGLRRTVEYFRSVDAGRLSA
jgi:nucleoside-diphosphate-sugar epimerase